MALPLPKVVADVEAGGPVVTAMRGQNALTNSALQNEISGVQAKYAPLTTQAEAASKLAYANLMGPQFLAKLLGNTDILANLTPEQRNAALQTVYAAGRGAGTGNAVLNAPDANHSGSSLTNFVNTLKNAFGFTGGAQPNAVNTPPPAQPSAVSNPFVNQPNVSPADQNAISNLQPGQSYVVQGNTPPIAQPATTPMTPPTSGIAENTFPENVGRYEGIKEEGKEAGKIRANDIKELSDTVFTGQTKQATLDNIGKIISSPEFEQIRQTPILGHHELSYYQKFGTPAQQNMVGQLMTLSGNVIRDASQDFKGAFRKGEQQLLENMKINPGDTVDAARGKMEQLSYLNRMITERARLTAQYMNQYHVSKLQAEQQADKQINGDQIRSHIHNTLNPKPTDEDIAYMAEKYKTTPEEIKKRLKAKGIY